jgi:hypothetical protein
VKTDPIDRAAAEEREQILTRHARVGPNGRPSRCHPIAEAGPDAKRKVIFPSKRAAERAEQALANLFGALRQTVYPCPYGDHWHLTRRRREEP